MALLVFAGAHAVAVDSEGDRLLTIFRFDPTSVTSVPLDPDVVNAQVAFGDGFRLVSGVHLYELDSVTGVTVERATFPAVATGVAARCEPDPTGVADIVLYAIARSVQRVYRVDVSTFTVVPLPQPLGLPEVESPKLGIGGAAGALWALDVNGVSPAAFTIDLTTGVATTVGSAAAPDAYGLGLPAPG